MANEPERTPIKFTIAKLEGGVYSGYQVICDGNIVITNHDLVEIEYDEVGLPIAINLIKAVVDE